MDKLNGESKDIVKENIKKLKEIFPEIVTEEKIDFENSYCFADNKSDLDILLRFGRSYSINNKALVKSYPRIKLLRWK